MVPGWVWVVAGTLAAIGLAVWGWIGATRPSQTGWDDTPEVR